MPGRASQLLLAAALVFFYKGPVTFIFAGSKPASFDALVKRELFPSQGKIVETVVHPGRAPGEPARVNKTTLVRRGDSAVFDAADADKTFSGTLTFKGDPWGPGAWNYDLTLGERGRLSGTGTLDKEGIKTDKVGYGADGKRLWSLTERLAPVTEAAFFERLRADFGLEPGKL